MNSKINYTRAIHMIKTLRHPRCRQFIEALDKAGKPVSVTDLSHILFWDFGFDFEQPVMSQILGRLRRYHFVNVTRDYKYHLYSLNKDRIDYVNHMVLELLNEMNTRVDGLGKIKKVK